MTLTCIARRRPSVQLETDWPGIEANTALASFTIPQKGGLLLTACACAKLLDNFPVMFPITLNFYLNYNYPEQHNYTDKEYSL